MAALPTRVRQGIRDNITSDTSQLVLTTKTLSQTLGYPLLFDPEWTILWNTLSPFYPDPATFAPSIASAINVWCEVFSSWLEDEKNEEDVDRLLEELKGCSSLRILVEISESLKRPHIFWNGAKRVFVLALAKSALPRAQEVLLAGFSTDMENIFKAPNSSDPKNTELGPEDAEDWADLGPGATETHTSIPDRSSRGLSGMIEEGEDSLPQVSTIERPEDLTRKPPYWMIVRQEGRQRVVVQGSHAPSLACLGEYLKRWCRTEMTRVDRPPMVEIKPQESVFGLGLLQDTLVMEAIRGKEVNVMLILVFVEKVLGYSSVGTNGSAGSVWEFKRTKGFR